MEYKCKKYAICYNEVLQDWCQITTWLAVGDIYLEIQNRPFKIGQITYDTNWDISHPRFLFRI